MNKLILMILSIIGISFSQSVLAYSSGANKESEQQKQERLYLEEYNEGLMLRKSDSYFVTTLKIKNKLNQFISELITNKNVAASEFFSIKNLNMKNIIVQMKIDKENLINDNLLKLNNLEFSVEHTSDKFIELQVNNSNKNECDLISGTFRADKFTSYVKVNGKIDGNCKEKNKINIAILKDLY